MSPIHDGINIGLKIAALQRHTRKVTKNLIVEKRLTITAVVDSILEKLSKLETELLDPNNSDAESGATDRYIYRTQNLLIEQLLRK